MFKILVTLAVLIGFIAHPIQSQAIQPPPPVTQTQPPFAFVEVMPVFKGGQAAMYKFISDNIFSCCTVTICNLFAAVSMLCLTAGNFLANS